MLRPTEDLQEVVVASAVRYQAIDENNYYFTQRVPLHTYHKRLTIDKTFF